MELVDKGNQIVPIKSVIKETPESSFTVKKQKHLVIFIEEILYGKKSFFEQCLFCENIKLIRIFPHQASDQYQVMAKDRQQMPSITHNQSSITYSFQ